MFDYSCDESFLSLYVGEKNEALNPHLNFMAKTILFQIVLNTCEGDFSILEVRKFFVYCFQIFLVPAVCLIFGPEDPIDDRSRLEEILITTVQKRKKDKKKKKKKSSNCAGYILNGLHVL